MKLRFGLLGSVLPIERAAVRPELVAGVTLAALAIPETLGYASIAGMPAVTGLYTMLVPMVVFALVGSSRHLVVGADSATAAILAAGLVGLAPPGSPAYVSLAGLAALMTAVWLLLARSIGLAFLADFLSRSVLIGFLTGVGVQVAASQLPAMLGVTANGTGTLEKLYSALSHLPETSLPTLAVALCVLGVIVGLQRLDRQIPGSLIAVVAAIAVSAVFDLQAFGVARLGRVPGGLPELGLPDASWTSIRPLLPTTISMFVVILAQSAATSRAYAARYDELLSENSDLVGLALANVGTGLTGSFVVNGSPTKTEIVDSAGGRTQLAQLACSVVVVCVLLFLTGPLAFLPDAALAAIVFLIGLGLVDLAGMRRILEARPREFWVALLTAAVVVVVGVEQGIIVAMAASLISHTRRGYSPHNSVLVPRPDGSWQAIPVTAGAQAAPGVVMYRFTHSLYYANSQKFFDEVLDLTRPGGAAVRCLCVDCTAIDDVDFTGGAMLRQVAIELRGRVVRLLFANVSEHVRQELDRSGVTGVVGNNAYLSDLTEASKACDDAQR
ncbi:MAG: SulP family inorganic anion transporter [Chloroflexi bacterium]|nr:SulP family inorganic anion transporter [Chloroflexota bacterium]